MSDTEKSTDRPDDASGLQDKDDAYAKRRLDTLKNRLDAIEGKSAAEQQEADDKSRGNQGVGNALRLGTEFVAGIAVGAFVGFWVDKLFGTWPVWFVIFFFLGVAAGFLNVFRTARRIQEDQNRLVAEGKLDLGKDLPDNNED